MTGIPNGDAPSIIDTSYNFKAELEIPPGGRGGYDLDAGWPIRRLRVLCAQRQARILYNLLDLKRTRWEGPDVLTPGHHTLKFDFQV